MRLIDADELLKWISGQSKSPSCPENESAFGLRIMKHIDRMPSVQTEIIHCKDCKHSEHWYRDKSRCFLWHEEGIDVFEDGFCNYAERKDDV